MCGAALAYFKDLPAPLRHMPELTAYCGAEEQLIEMIFKWFRCVLRREEQSLVKEADVSLRHYEAANIFCAPHARYRYCQLHHQGAHPSHSG